MKIVFFGSGKFAVKILETLYAHKEDVVAVVTQPDRKKGRHLQLAPTPVKAYALAHACALFQPENINDPQGLSFLRDLDADIFIVVSYGRILSREVLSIPKIMPVNIHASLLPKYRGAAPIQWALINGDKKTGITFICMNEFMDKGDVILQKSLKIGQEYNSISLDAKLSCLAASCLPKVLKIVARKKVSLKKQGSTASLAPRIKKQDGLIVWTDTSKQIIDKFKGCMGWPGSFTYFKGKILKMLDMRAQKGRAIGHPGQILKIENDRMEVSCGKGIIVITEVLPESQHRMSPGSFAVGHQVKTGDFLGT